MAVDPRKTLPTKINLIRLRREYKTIKKIRGVLEEKRSALILYIRSLIDKYEELYSNVFRNLREAYEHYEQVLPLVGYEEAKKIAESFPPNLSVTLREKVLFAVRVPAIMIDEKQLEEMDIPVNVPLDFTASLSKLKEAFKGFLELVELEFSLRKLIDELKSTQRLINAIDHVIIPSYEKTIKHIKLVLDERMREEFLRLKELKAKMERRRAEVAQKII